MDQPEEVVPLPPGNGLLAKQLEYGRPHGGPLVLEGQLVLVLQHLPVAAARSMLVLDGDPGSGPARRGPG